MSEQFQILIDAIQEQNEENIDEKFRRKDGSDEIKRVNITMKDQLTVLNKTNKDTLNILTGWDDTLRFLGEIFQSFFSGMMEPIMKSIEEVTSVLQNQFATENINLEKAEIRTEQDDNKERRRDVQLLGDDSGSADKTNKSGGGLGILAKIAAFFGLKKLGKGATGAVGKAIATAAAFAFLGLKAALVVAAVSLIAFMSGPIFEEFDRLKAEGFSTGDALSNMFSQLFTGTINTILGIGDLITGKMVEEETKARKEIIDGKEVTVKEKTGFFTDEIDDDRFDKVVENRGVVNEKFEKLGEEHLKNRKTIQEFQKFKQTSIDIGDNEGVEFAEEEIIKLLKFNRDIDTERTRLIELINEQNRALGFSFSRIIKELGSPFFTQKEFKKGGKNLEQTGDDLSSGVKKIIEFLDARTKMTDLEEDDLFDENTMIDRFLKKNTKEGKVKREATVEKIRKSKLLSDEQKTKMVQVIEGRKDVVIVSTDFDPTAGVRYVNPLVRTPEKLQAKIQLREDTKFAMELLATETANRKLKDDRIKASAGGGANIVVEGNKSTTVVSKVEHYTGMNVSPRPLHGGVVP